MCCKTKRIEPTVIPLIVIIYGIVLTITIVKNGCIELEKKIKQNFIGEK